MRRGLLGMGILAVLLILCLMIMTAAAVLPRQLAADLQAAAEAALSEDWEKTAALTGKARAAWEEIRLFYCCITSQDEIQEMDSLFLQAAAYVQAEETGSCAAACLSLADQARSLGEDQILTIQYFL